MILSDNFIKHLAVKKNMIEPFFGSSVSRLPDGRPCTSYGLSSYGYDIRLGDSFMFFRGEENKMINFTKDGKQETIFIESKPKTIVDPNDFESSLVVQVNEVQEILIPPKTFFMGVSMEYMKIPREVSVLCNGKSTIARSGLLIYVTPLEPEWEGFITLEFFNSTDSIMRLTPGMGISQLAFISGNGLCEVSYGDRAGKYQFQGNRPIPPLKKV